MVYGLNRSSEDLDFDNSAGIELGDLAENLKNMFQNRFAYQDASVKPQQSAQGILGFTLKLPVLKDLGVSSALIPAKAN